MGVRWLAVLIKAQRWEGREPSLWRRSNVRERRRNSRRRVPSAQRFTGIRTQRRQVVPLRPSQGFDQRVQHARPLGVFRIQLVMTELDEECDDLRSIAIGQGAGRSTSTGIAWVTGQSRWRNG